MYLLSKFSYRIVLYKHTYENKNYNNVVKLIKMKLNLNQI